GGELPALVEARPGNRGCGLQHGGGRGHIRLRAGVWEEVREGSTEERLRTLDGERPGDVDPLAPAVIPAPRVALGVLVRQDAPHGLHDGGAGVVLRGDELDLLDLPPTLVLDRRVDLGIDAFHVTHVPLLIPRERSATMGSPLSSSAICSRRRACRPPCARAPRYASTMLFASDSPRTRSPSVSRFTSTCSTASRADHSFSTTAARTPG